MSLAAVRVLDLSMGWAGPMVSFVLANLGAEVIKVEARRRFDWWRGPPARDRQNPELAHAHELSAVFNSVNRHKRGLTLDLGAAEGRAALLDLARIADVLVENFTPHAMEALGLSYATLGAVNPQLVMISMPAFGATGPERDYIGYGMTMEAMAGMSALTGYEDGPPQMLSNAYGDPVSGLNGAVAALVALRRRPETGRGAHVEVAQVEAFIPLVAGALLERQMTGRDPTRMGNRHRSMAPHGVYECDVRRATCEGGASDRGTSDLVPRADCWVAITVGSDQEWVALCGAIGREELACDPRFADVVSRKRNEREIDAVLVAWTAGRTREDAVAALRAAGVAAAPVQTSADLLADARLAERAFFTVVERAHVGTHPYPGMPFRLEPAPEPEPLPAPCLGEHSEAVLMELLGMGAAEFERLVDAGISGAGSLA